MGKSIVQALHRLEREQATFRIVPAGQSGGVLDQLRAVSDDWLAKRSGGEKGFSLGFFEPQYIARFPIAVIEQGGRIVAFANLWPGAQRFELSTDMMRYDDRAPKDVMDALFAHVMLWGKEQGYRWFAMGMAPLSGFETSSVAPLVEPPCLVSLRARGERLQLSRPQSLQAEIRSRLAATLSRISGRPSTGARAGGCRGADRGRVPENLSQMKTQRAPCASW